MLWKRYWHREWSKPVSLLDTYADRWIKESNGCYRWTGAVAGKGRPVVKRGGSNYAFSRLVCEEVNGPSPTSKHQAAHDTSNGCIGMLCVNPDHIRWATPVENVDDKPRKYPKFVTKHKYGFRVRVRGYSVGIFPTLEQALEKRDAKLRSVT